MKKILLPFLLLTSFLGNSQEVSPFYPAKYVGERGFGFTSQMTYFDLNFINTHVSEFLNFKMAMAIQKTDSSKLLHEGGKLTVAYVDKITQGKPGTLTISYDVVKVSDIYTIQAVKITGDKLRLVDFFVEFWNTTPNFQEPSGNADVSLNMGQDVVKYYFNKGKPYITITNGTYKNLEEFRTFFASAKAGE